MCYIGLWDWASQRKIWQEESAQFLREILRTDMKSRHFHEKRGLKASRAPLANIPDWMGELREIDFFLNSARHLSERREAGLGDEDRLKRA
jgi:hypothetical protein